MKQGKAQGVLQHVLTELLQYTEQHFAGEEAAMKSAGYPQLQAQIDQHRKFTSKIKEVTEKYKAGGLGISVGVLDFLTDWLKQHIIGVDKQYSEFMNARGIV